MQAATNGVRAVAAGAYLVSATANLVGGASGERSVSIRDGATALREFGGGVAGRYAFSDVLILAASATLTMTIYSAVAVTVNGATVKDATGTLTYLGPTA